MIYLVSHSKENFKLTHTVEDAYEQNLSTPKRILPSAPWVLRILSAVNDFDTSTRTPRVNVRWQPVRPVDEELTPDWDFSKVSFFDDLYLNLEELGKFEKEGVDLKHMGNKLFFQLLRSAGVTGVTYAEAADELPNTEVVAWIEGTVKPGKRYPDYRIMASQLSNANTFLEV